MSTSLSEYQRRADLTDELIRTLRKQVSSLKSQVKSSEESNTQELAKTDTVKAYYWPGISNRGNRVKLLLSEAGVNYELCDDYKTITETISCRGGSTSEEQFPVFAPPLVDINGTILSQTGPTVRYLAKRYGLYPSGLNGIQAEVIGENCADVFNQSWIQRTFQLPLEEFQKYYFDPKGRMALWLEVFESILNNRTKTNQSTPYFFENRVTFVDLLVYNMVFGLYDTYNTINNVNRFDCVLNRYPKLKLLYNTLDKRESVQRVVKPQRESNSPFWPWKLDKVEQLVKPWSATMGRLNSSGEVIPDESSGNKVSSEKPENTTNV